LSNTGQPDIILLVKINYLHGWEITTSSAAEIQRNLAGRVVRSNTGSVPRYVAGVDISVSRVTKQAAGAVVVIKYPELEPVETKIARGKLDFPYIPGLLSFRELPLALAAFEMLETAPDLVVVDGQGIAHPRRFGLASHLGLFLERPTIGCAKSLLCGVCDEPGNERGCSNPLIDKGEIIGTALRTRTGVKPVYVSIGHGIDLETAAVRVLDCCRGYRLPEPTRLAHIAAGEGLRQGG
jgi:deoxyribonuclease V